ncbi:hypothetical protein ILYODFUR_021099 [Ilyodon furcidens]|uniref:Neurotransmitter-gated ion-channel ligand-binding domain-containing protein n=1 Tax=Ilyodon furcidens TaxID=33524 RepID=A0ABV0UHY1_9TELE
MAHWRVPTILHSFLFFSTMTKACEGADAKYAQKLLTDLMTNYTSALRPVEDTNTILNVTLQVTLSQIIDMVKHQSTNIKSSMMHFKCSFSRLKGFYNIILQ